MGKLISDKYKQWESECEARFQKLKSNEEELNRIFIDIYGLQDELTPEVEDRNVTVRRADLQREIRSLLSYAVGCLFGRYSLDVDGLCYAGGEWDAGKYKTIIPVKDNVLPICDDDYLESDLTGKIVDFVKTVYGEDTLEENLKFIADALGTTGGDPELSAHRLLRRPLQNLPETPHLLAVQLRQKARVQGTGLYAPLGKDHRCHRPHRLRSRAAGTLPDAAFHAGRTAGTGGTVGACEAEKAAGETDRTAGRDQRL